MNRLMETNIYEPKGNVLIIGSCLPQMQPEGYAKLSKNFDMVFSVCLEETHINMIITKLCGIISVGKVHTLSFASVDRSPHCIQLHYIQSEIERIMNKKNLIDMFNYIIVNNEIIDINKETVSLSRNLLKISNLIR